MWGKYKVLLPINKNKIYICKFRKNVMDYSIYLGIDAALGGIQISGLLMMMQNVNYDICKLPLKKVSPVTVLSLLMSQAVTDTSPRKQWRSNWRQCARKKSRKWGYEPNLNFFNHVKLKLFHLPQFEKSHAVMKSIALYLLT